ACPALHTLSLHDALPIYAVLGEELVAHQPYAIEVEVHRSEVEQWYAALVGGGQRDIPGIGDAARHELRDDARLALAGGAQGFQHRRLLDHAVLYQPLRQAAEPRARGAAERQRYVVIHGLRVVELGLKEFSLPQGRLGAIVKSLPILRQQAAWGAGCASHLDQV